MGMWLNLTLICLTLTITAQTSAQSLNSTQLAIGGICKTMYCNTMEALNRLKDCVIVLGNLQVLFLGRTTKNDFENIEFPNLREVTGAVVLYRVFGLESVGKLFPNLARIRGSQLLSSYGLIIHDVPHLKEVGLYGLLKIDRGGVVIWGGAQTCYSDTVDWDVIAPASRHVLSPPDKDVHCGKCVCHGNTSNYCWNPSHCQRLLDREKCHPECLGCSETNPEHCSVCRHFTYKGNCVARCPSDTIILSTNNYCFTIKQCESLGGWKWHDNCIFECPAGYIATRDPRIKSNTPVTCVPCTNNCHQTCNTQQIQSLNTIQTAEKCVYINGSLVIHLWDIPGALEELRHYLSRIQEVEDYVIIIGSHQIISLDFLSSLRRIGGRKLFKNKYSLVIQNLNRLHELFSYKVTKNLVIERGTMRLYGNSELCMSEIEKLKVKFPVQPSALDVPQGMNGYSGACAEAVIGLKIKVINETKALISFRASALPEAQYSLLYMRVPAGAHAMFIPEACSEAEWHSIHIGTGFGYLEPVELNSLRPASTYAVCIETFDPRNNTLVRNPIVNFTTPVGTPEPPFLIELMATTHSSVEIRWADHIDFRAHVTRYELDVHIMDIQERDITLRDHCWDSERGLIIEDFDRHAVVMKPPPEYYKTCESMCEALSCVKDGTLIEDYFDICSFGQLDCNEFEQARPKNVSYDGYIHAVALNISHLKNYHLVEGLAPYRNYKFSLRACVGNQCSRVAKSVIKTLRMASADVPKVTQVHFNGENVTILWDHPNVTNGPVLAYLVFIRTGQDKSVTNTRQSRFCVSPKETSLNVTLDVTDRCIVTVCSVTLASPKACSPDMILTSKDAEISWLWMSVIVSLILFASSIGVSSLVRREMKYDDEVPLVDSTSMYRSETPLATISDLIPFYSVHHDSDSD